MNAIKTVAKEVKVAIAVEAVKTPGTKAIVLATQFGVSESTVRRAIKEFETEAKALIEAEAKKAAAPKTVKAKRSKVENAAEAGPRGYKGRNGRWSILNALFDEKGIDSPVAELYVEANKRSVEAGLNPLNKNSFYAMVGIARKLRKQAAE